MHNEKQHACNVLVLLPSSYRGIPLLLSEGSVPGSLEKEPEDYPHHWATECETPRTLDKARPVNEGRGLLTHGGKRLVLAPITHDEDQALRNTLYRCVRRMDTSYTNQ